MNPAPLHPDDSRYRSQRHRILLALSKFTVPLLRRTYREFGGDPVAAIVLGEIALRNIGAWLAREENDATALEDIARHGEVLRPCNALSVAEASGIPRETVRRKVAALIERGLVYRDSGGNLFVMPGTADGFDAMTLDTVDALLKSAHDIEALLAARPAGAPPSP